MISSGFVPAINRSLLKSFTLKTYNIANNTCNAWTSDLTQQPNSKIFGGLYIYRVKELRMLLAEIGGTPDIIGECGLWQSGEKRRLYKLCIQTYFRGQREQILIS